MKRSLKPAASRCALCGLIVAALLAGSSHTATAAGPRILPAGKLPQDKRLGALKDLNAYFPFEVPKSKQDWQLRAEQLRTRILVTNGLWPMPEKTPAQAMVHGRVQRKGFTVDKVYFESYPGHFVTGLLFMPENPSLGKHPAVLCPHGHGGRLQDLGKSVVNQIAYGGERFEQSGRFPKLARCAQLARMGCVVFIFDMLGYADSVQISRALAHGFRTQRPDFDKPDSWGFFSTQAELRLQSIMGLQTYNSIRALDWLSSLPQVDAKRMAVTGGSGGGTQTILLCAIDPRPIAAFPQGMVSTSMQGGCTCENTSLLRIGTGNVELAGLFAPKPMGMTAANDWTKAMMTKGYPQLRQLYSLYGRQQNVMCKEQLHFPHNYNYVTRALMYSWFNKHLKLGLPAPIVEEDYELLTPEEYTVWNDKHPKPAGGDDHERYLTRTIHQISDRQLAVIRPSDDASLAKYRQVVGGAWQVLVDNGLPGKPGKDNITRKKILEHDNGDYIVFGDIIRNKHIGSELPVYSIYPSKQPWNKRVTLWLGGEGKSVLFDGDKPRKEVLDLLKSGTAVMSADLFQQGEFLAGTPSKSTVAATQNRVVANPREFAGYTYGYNQPLLAQRVDDILTVLHFARSAEHQAESLTLIGTGDAAPAAAIAAALASDSVDRAVIQSSGFRFVNLNSYRHPQFIPGAVKYGDMPGLLALIAPRHLRVVGDKINDLQLTVAAYQASGHKDQLRVLSDPIGKAISDLAQ